MTDKTTFSVSDLIGRIGGLSGLASSSQVDLLVPNTRMPALILMDTSGSMQGNEEAMQDAIEQLYERLFENNYSRSCAEVGIMSFNEIIEVLAPMREINPATNNGKGLRINCRLQTLTGLALAAALDHLERRTAVYRDNDMRYNSPILFFFSDGIPYVSRKKTAQEDMEALAEVLEKIRELVERNLLVVIAYELGNDCDHELMTRITGLPDDRHVRKFSRTKDDMADLFKVTSSMIISSSRRGTFDANSMSIDEILGQ